ncbi:acetyltransferase [Vibrio lentus]|uniref:Acetyltransferase n=1 Tax=Vibrio lentus TaxID=136468 RepID=A0AB36XMW5_9VIBR|nr:acetyltransferase [Vibrio lentus]MCC4837796.1 acetyltransferase [Vibrio lentus]MDH5929499.1 acetyltransferase [Vibrio lentus]PMI15675.1 acetyltransferase [Vibrio lentus]PMK31412.1 acetyltransferase [Vibrio lentus]PMK46304.1 acetyltransferase [Vibrio lentus]
MNRCAVLGASGHGKVVAEIAECNGYNQIDFFDDRWPELVNHECWSVQGNTEALLANVEKYDLIVISIGNNTVRLEKQRILKNAGGIFKALVHPNAIVSHYAQIGAGSVVMANAVVGAFAKVGQACIVNTSSSVDHDCVLCDGVHISPGVNLAGSVNVGEGAWVGIGSQVKQLISIGSFAVIGAGATVINDIPSNQVVIGTPAKCINIL